MDDLEWMRWNGLDEAICSHAKTGLVVGICGGMQMLGEEITDPDGIERHGSMPGLGLLPISTQMQAQKVTRISSGSIRSAVLFDQLIPDSQVTGYEIHVGKTSYLQHAIPFATLGAGKGLPSQPDGCISADTHVLGSYLHGLFDDDNFRHQFIAAARTFYRLSSPASVNPWKSQRESSFDRLAIEVERSLDMSTIFQWAGMSYQLSPSSIEGAAQR